MRPEFSAPAEDLAGKGKEYLDARVDDVKLRLVKGLSISASKLLGLILFLGVVSAFLLVLSFGLILLMAEWWQLGYGVSAMIVAGVLLLVSIIVFILRDKMFQSSFVVKHRSSLHLVRCKHGKATCSLFTLQKRHIGVAASLNASANTRRGEPFRGTNAAFFQYSVHCISYCF